MRWSLLAGVAVGPPMTGREVVPLRASRGRSASASWTVRMCFVRASERVKLRSHSATVSQARRQVGKR